MEDRFICLDDFVKFVTEYVKSDVDLKSIDVSFFRFYLRSVWLSGNTLD